MSGKDELVIFLQQLHKVISKVGVKKVLSKITDITLDDKNRIHIAGKAQYMHILVKEHFGLDKPLANVSTIKVDSTLVLEKKRKTSDDESYENKLIRVPFVEREDMPNLVIFQDGSVYNKKIKKFSSTC